MLQGYPSGPWAIPLLQKVGFFRFLGIGSFQRAMSEIVEVSHLSELLSARLPGCHTGHLMGCMCFPTVGSWHPSIGICYSANVVEAVNCTHIAL